MDPWADMKPRAPKRCDEAVGRQCVAHISELRDRDANTASAACIAMVLSSKVTSDAGRKSGGSPTAASQLGHSSGILVTRIRVAPARSAGLCREGAKAGERR
jgi:hypothetical protein